MNVFRIIYKQKNLLKIFFKKVIKSLDYYSRYIKISKIKITMI